MASKREGRLKISAMPWRDGLATAGQQTTIPETALWQAANTTAELDGMISKRPGLRRWGQTLVDPALVADTRYGFTETWSTGNEWAIQTAITGGGLVDAVVQNGGLVVSVDAGSTANYGDAQHFYNFGADATATTYSVRFQMRATNLQAYVPAVTDANTMFMQFAVAGSTKRIELAVWSGGLYYKQASDDTYVLIAGTSALANGGWHTLELQVDTAGSVVVKLDETTVSGSGILHSAMKDTSGTNTANVVLFGWQVVGDSTTQYLAEIGTVQYIDTNSDPFTTQAIKAISDFAFITPSGSAQTVLLAAAGEYLWFDSGLTGNWKSLLQLQYQDVSVTTYRRTAIIIDASRNVPTVVYQWDGVNAVEALTDAPNLKFATEHKQRLWGAGDSEFPLRLYFSGDRQPNLWFSPSPDNIEDQVDAAEQAGYLEIPSKRGDKITAVYGDYYGRLLVWTRRGVWQVSGDGPASFSLASISQDVGAENSDCVTQVGNDIWFMGRYGVQALSATDQFGDIQSGMPSAPISDLWSQSPSAVTKISRSLLSRSRLKYNPTQGLVYCAVPTTGEDGPDSVFVYNVNIKRWYGPWEIESDAMENIEIGLPLIEVMAHGGSDGQVLITDTYRRKDVETGYTMTLQSAYLNGRSLNPALAGLMKTWKKLRLFVLPRGDWDFTVQWRTDNDKAKDAVTVNQNQYDVHVLGNVEGDGTGDFRLTLDPDARLHTREEMAVLEVSLDSRGYALRFTIEQSGAGEDLVIQGFEVEFQPDGYEED
jgi:hypothetical protein